MLEADRSACLSETVLIICMYIAEKEMFVTVDFANCASASQYLNALKWPAKNNGT